MYASTDKVTGAQKKVVVYMAAMECMFKKRSTPAKN